MASAKQIAWRKKFARMAKAGKFRKKNPAKRSYSEGGRPENLAWMKKYKKYYGTSKPANPDYVYMLNEKGELRGVKKSDIKKYKLGKGKARYKKP